MLGNLRVPVLGYPSVALEGHLQWVQGGTVHGGTWRYRGYGHESVWVPCCGHAYVHLLEVGKG
jgi:hypothetical protein